MKKPRKDPDLRAWWEWYDWARKMYFYSTGKEASLLLNFYGLSHEIEKRVRDSIGRDGVFIIGDCRVDTNPPKKPRKRARP